MKKMCLHRRLTLLPILLLCFSTGFAQTNEATVVAWNVQGVEFVGEPPTPRPVARARQIVEAVTALEFPAVIALCEVSSRADVRAAVDELEENDVRYGVVMPAQSVPQKIAILFKEGVTVTNARFVPGSEAGQAGRLRKALSARVKIGQFDFILIAVHLKSGRGTAERATRTTQTQAIANFVRQQTTREKDVLIVGDYNMVPTQDDANFNALNPDNLLRFISSESLTGQPSHISSCVRGQPRGNLLDGFAVSREHTREFVADSLKIVQLHAELALSCRDFLRTVSDHLPLVARFRIDADDDN